VVPSKDNTTRDTMRNVGSSLETKTELAGASQITVSAVIENSRAFWDSLWISNKPSGLPGTGIQADTEGFDSCYRSSDSTFYAVYNDSGTIKGMKSSSSSLITISGVNSIHATASRPGIYCDTSNNLWLWYVASSGNLYRSQLNVSSTPWTLSGTQSMSAATTKAAVHPVSETEAVICHVDGTVEGTYRVRYAKYTGSWTSSLSSDHILEPTVLWGINEVVDSAGAKNTAGVFAYFSDRTTGTVYGWRYDAGDNLWDKPQVVVEGDLSKFVITNACVYDDMIYLAGQFERTEDLAVEDYADEPYSLFWTSGDGYHFAIDRTTLVSIQGYPFQAIVTSSYVYGYAYNQVGRDEIPGAQTLVIDKDDILSFSAESSLDGGMGEMLLSNADETYSDSALVAIDNICTVDAGYEDDEIQYGRYVITGVQETWGDAIRQLAIQLQHLGFERSSSFVHPFYTEISSKSSHYVDLLTDTETGKLFVAGNGGIYTDFVDVDFWFSQPYEGIDGNTEGIDILLEGGPTFQKVGDTTTRHVRTQTIKDHCMLIDHPSIIEDASGTISDIDVWIWATSRTLAAGKDSNYFSPRLIVENADGEDREETYDSMLTTPNYPPRTYHDDDPSGHYPMKFRFNASSFSTGDKIKYIAVAIATLEANQTEWLLDRVRLINVNCMWQDGRGGSGWMPGGNYGAHLFGRDGRPFIMLSTKPYKPEEFIAIAKFKIVAPSKPNCKTYVGIACYASDLLNYHVFRVYLDDSKNGRFEHVIVREGREDIRAYSTVVDLTVLESDFYLKAQVQGGRYKVSWRATTGDTWADILESVVATEASGPAATDDTQMHVGIYGYNANPVIRVHGTKPGYLDVLGALPGWEDGFDDFPTTGRISFPYYGIATYDGKLSGSATTGNKTIGPFSARRSASWKTNGSEAGSVDFLYFNNDLTPDTVFAADYGQTYDNGIGWAISYSNFNVNEGGAHPLFRSRHFTSADDIGNQHGQGTRSYISLGFENPAHVGSADDEASIPFGTFGILSTTGRPYCKEFILIAGPDDLTVRDMIKRTALMAGADIGFEDYIDASLALSAGTYSSYLRPATDLGANAYDINFTMPQLGDGQILGIYSTAEFTLNGTAGHIIGIRHKTGTYDTYAVALNDSLTVIDEVYIGQHTSGTKDVRIVMYGNMATVYWNRHWGHTFYLSEVDWPEKATAIRFYLSSGSGKTVTDILVPELFKVREAVYFEMDSSSDSSIGSIIQGRPIMFIPKSDGSIVATHASNTMSIHKPAEHTVSSNIVRRHSKDIISGAGGAASDYVVYYADVRAYRDVEYAKAYGFRTKVLSLGDFDEDEITYLVYLLSKQARESMIAHNISIRPDFFLEPGDVANISYTLSGTGTVINIGKVLVESITFSSKANAMNISGRVQEVWS